MLKPPHSQHTALNDFFTTPLDVTLSRFKTISPETKALEFFLGVVRDVPAYREFLSAQGIDPARICTFTDFQTLPLVTKQNYMLVYPLPSLCRGGSLRDCEMIAVSSGSTGKPMFWPRSTAHELDIAARFEQIFHHAFDANQQSTLVVICFALGTWVGGMYTTMCCRYLAQKGYPITVVTPGNNKGEIFRVIEELGGMFDQIVLAGYPPFLKDVIDTGITQGIAWPRHRMRLIMAGEVFSEEWRSLVCERLGADDPRYHTASLYGTADAGVLGAETPISIALRRFFAAHPDATREAFGESRLPTLVQYDPLSRFFEVHEGTLVVSGDNGVPLVRYHIADKGGIYRYDDMLALTKRWGYDPLKELDAQADNRIDPLPFVYLFGRADFTVSYFGANIYPENVTVGLEQDGIKQWVSGKFVLEVKETADRNKLLHVVVELAPGAQPKSELADAIATSIRNQLLRLNSEFANYVPAQFQMPQVMLAQMGDPDYFPLGVKHRYTRR
ncbi:MAG: phenylacetate--CoA ligase family protein [Pseudomonadota bacterium]